MSRLPISITSTIATTTSSMPIARLPIASQRALLVSLGQRHTRRGRTRGRAARRSPRAARPGARDSWCPDELPPRLPAGRTRFASPIASGTTDDSSTMPRARHGNAQIGSRARADARSSRCLRKSEHTAEHEQHHRDDERPEVARRSVTEWMRLVRRAAGAATRRATATPGCRYRPRSGSTPRASTADCVKTKPTSFATAIPRLARNAAMTARRLPSALNG